MIKDDAFTRSRTTGTELIYAATPSCCVLRARVHTFTAAFQALCWLITIRCSWAYLRFYFYFFFIVCQECLVIFLRVTRPRFLRHRKDQGKCILSWKDFRGAHTHTQSVCVCCNQSSMTLPVSHREGKKSCFQAAVLSFPLYTGLRVTASKPPDLPCKGKASVASQYNIFLFKLKYRIRSKFT